MNNEESTDKKVEVGEPPRVGDKAPPPTQDRTDEYPNKIESSVLEGPADKHQVPLMRESFWDVSISDCVMAIATIVMAFSAVTYTYYAGQQWDVMKQSLDETKAAAIEAKRAADAAEKSIQSTIDMFWAEQRAWVGVVVMRAIDEPQADKPFLFEIQMQNSGRTPALEFTTYHHRRTEYPSKRAVEARATVGSSKAAIAPGATALGNVGGGYDLTEADVQKIKSGEVKFHVFGRIDYKGTTGKSYVTTYCGIYSYKKHPTIDYCSHFNEMK